jgi:hypothetical protein
MGLALIVESTSSSGPGRPRGRLLFAGGMVVAVSGPVVGFRGFKCEAVGDTEAEGVGKRESVAFLSLSLFLSDSSGTMP